MHSGERTGSELALYNLVEHAAGAGWEVGVACRRDGPLLKQMPHGVRTYILNRQPGRLRRVYNRLSRVPAHDPEGGLMEVHEEFAPDAWYLNTLPEARLLRRARANNIPCVLHSHEMEHMLFINSGDEAELMVEYPKLVIAGSRAAADVLRTLGRRRGLEICYATINPEKIRLEAGKSAAIRRGLGIADGTFVWAMAGTLDPNKNPVRFAEVAHDMLRQGHDVHFLWVGGGDSGYARYARKRAEELGLGGRLSWLGHRSDDYYDCLNAAGGFLLTSSRESFSLVSAEAAYMGKPVVSFDSGGVREIIREGMGVVVDSWNNSDLIRAMLGVMRNEVGFDADAARERVKEFYVSAQAPRWEKIVREHLAGEGAAAPARLQGG